MQVRTSVDGRALIALKLAVAPLVDEPADLLDALLALPWLPRTALFSHVRNRLMEDLLVDLCELEGSEEVDADPVTEGPADDDGLPPVARKKSKKSEDYF